MQKQGLFLTRCLILNLSQNFIVTDFGKVILFPFKVTLTSFQSIAIISQDLFLFSLTFLDFNVPVILNKWILSAVLHNFFGM